MEMIILPAEPLTALEREEIRAGIERGDTNADIARELGRHRATIGREITRNGDRTTYRAARAETRARQMCRRPKVPKLVTDPVLAAHVTQRLQELDSPKRISLELEQGMYQISGRVSHETIYRAIYARGTHGLPDKVHVGLHRKRRRRRQRGVPHHNTQAILGDFNQIHDRPPQADARSEVGHLEGDLIIGAMNKTAIVTIFDRASRYVWLAGFPGRHSADETLIAVTSILERIPAHARHTLTWDRGREMARHRDIAAINNITIYFADPHSPWQRPTNENGNQLIRRWVGKGTNLAQYTPNQLRHIEHRINTIPRRTLNWDTAHNVYTQLVAMTT